MIAEPLTGQSLRDALRAIVARPVEDLPLPEQTERRENSAANGRAAAAKQKSAVWAVARGMQATGRKPKAKVKVAATPKPRPAPKPKAKVFARTFDRAAALADMAAGETIEAVAIKHNVSIVWLNRIRCKAGMPKAKREPKPPRDCTHLRKCDHAAVLADVANGMRQADAAKKYGILKQTVSMIVKRGRDAA